MKRYKKKYNVYSAWNYEQEVLDLNAQSEKGWQLIKGKSFSHKYEYNPEVCYRYQLDYLPGISVTQEMPRLLDTYRDQGWEFVNKTFNGWYYFRKAYDPTLSEDEYQLYTDRSSLKAMQGRWAAIATILAVITGIYFLLCTLRLFRQPCLPFFTATFTYGFVFFTFLRAILLMRNPEKPKAHKWDCPFTLLFLVVLIGGTILSVTLLTHRPYNTCRSTAEYYSPLPAELPKATQWNSFFVSYKDRYYLDLDIDAEVPICFTITDNTGKIIYTIKGSDISEEDLMLRLDKGDYRIYLSDFAGGGFDISYQFE